MTDPFIAAWSTAASRFPPATPLLYADLAPEATTLVPPAGPRPGPILRLPWGAESLARRLMRHTPPTALELEQAIETIEPEIMALRLHLPAGTLIVLGGAWPQALAATDPGLHRDAVENLFQHLAAIAQGRPAGIDALPTDPTFFAAVLLLRELMHHLGLERAVAEAPAPSPPA